MHALFHGILGLGNPGERYSKSRHNAGFMAIDRLSQAWDPTNYGKEKTFLWESGAVHRASFVLVKPLTFMNVSGLAAGALLRRFPLVANQNLGSALQRNIPLASLLVIHDDLALPFGKLRAKQGGGAGGHNGLKHIDQLVGNTYWRLRIGIGHPGASNLVSDYVLENFSQSEEPMLHTILAAIPRLCSLWLDGDHNAFIQQTESFRTP